MKTPQLKTGCWFGQIPDDHVRIGISRRTPRGLSTGHRLYPKLNPGEWFNGVPAAEYIKRYNAEILCKLKCPEGPPRPSQDRRRQSPSALLF
jgi:hypothetical protein